VLLTLSDDVTKFIFLFSLDDFHLNDFFLSSFFLFLVFRFKYFAFFSQQIFSLHFKKLFSAGKNKMLDVPGSILLFCVFLFFLMMQHKFFYYLPFYVIYFLSFSFLSNNIYCCSLRTLIIISCLIIFLALKITLY
jgi:hypothetical protein